MLQKSPMYAYIPAAELARARKFYEEKLGFKPKEEMAGGVIYEFGEGTSCFMYPTPNPGTSKASQAFWRVDQDRERGGDYRERKGRVVQRFLRRTMSSRITNSEMNTSGMPIAM